MKDLPVPDTRVGWVSALVVIIVSFFLYYGWGYGYLSRIYRDARITVSFYPPEKSEEAEEKTEEGKTVQTTLQTIPIEVQMRVPRYLSSFAPQPVTIVFRNTSKDESITLDRWSILARSCSDENTQENEKRQQEEADDSSIVLFCPSPDQTSTMCLDNANFGGGETIYPGDSIQRTLWATANHQNKQTGTVCFDIQISTDNNREPDSLTSKEDNEKRTTISNWGSTAYGIIRAILLPPWANGFIPIWGLFYVFIVEDCIPFPGKSKSHRLFLEKVGILAVFYFCIPVFFFSLPLALLLHSISLWVPAISLVMMVGGVVYSNKSLDLSLSCLFHREESPINAMLPFVGNVTHHLLSIEQLFQATQSGGSEQLGRVGQALADLARILELDCCKGSSSLLSGIEKAIADLAGILEQLTRNNGEESLALQARRALALPWSPTQLIDTEEIAAWYRESLSHLPREAFQQLLIADTEGRFISQMLTLLSKMLADAERNPEEQGRHRLQLSNGDFEDSLVASPIWAIRETGRPNFLRKWHSYMKDFPEYREALYRWLFKRKAGWAEEHFFTVILPAAGDSSQESVPLLCIYIKHMQEAGKWVEIPWKRILEYLMNTIDKSTHIPEKAWNVLKPGGTQDKFLWEVVEEKTPFGSEEARALHKWLQDILCIVPVSFFEPIAEKIFTSLEYYNLTDDEDFKKFADAYGRFKQPDGSLDGLREAWCPQGDSAGGVEKP